MTLPDPFLVGVGGALGAVLRSLTNRAVGDAGRLPYGTLTVNVLGSVVLGAVAFSGVGGATATLVGVGVCGAYTTFSSFSVETVGLLERGDRRGAVLNGAANLVGSLAGVLLGAAAVGGL